MTEYQGKQSAGRQQMEDVLQDRVTRGETNCQQGSNYCL